MGPRITFIGGGSYQWFPKLVVDIANTPSLQNAEIVIEDLAAGPIPSMVQLVERIAEVRGIGITATGTTDQRTALRDADYVVVCISTGALDSMAHDVTIPERYGIKQSVGDTVGPGGILRTLRNVPVMVGIARDMQELCPQAWLLNLTNPMTTLTRSVLATTEIEAIGLCHEVTISQFQLSLLLDCDMRAMDLRVTGVNHLPIITEIDIDGSDGLAQLSELVDDAALRTMTIPFDLGEMIGHEAVSAGGRWTKGQLIDANQVKLELFHRFGALPAAGDRHLVEFFPGFLTEQSQWGKRWGVRLTDMEERRHWIGRHKTAFEAMLASGEVSAMPSGEMVAAVIDSRLRDKARTFPLNIANAGQCVDLPLDVVVESMCVVDAQGVRGRDEVEAPPILGEYLRRVSSSQELTVEAALTGSRDLTFEAMLADPLASRIDYDALWKLTNEMIDATAAWLPQFA